MSYYQVLISLESGPMRLRQIMVDLSEQELHSRLLGPYRRGAGLACGSEIIPSLSIRRIHIVRTAQIDRIARARLGGPALRQVGGAGQGAERALAVAAPVEVEPEDIFEVGEEVTAQYISGPPGAGARRSLLERGLERPWTVAVIASAGLLVLVWWLALRR